MTQKVNPKLFRIKKYNFITSFYTNFFDNINQYYLIKRNLYFFIKYFKKSKFFIFYFKIKRNILKVFKLFFLGFFLRQHNYFFIVKHLFVGKKKVKKKKKEKRLYLKVQNFFLKKKKSLSDKKNLKYFFLVNKNSKLKKNFSFYKTRIFDFFFFKFIVKYHSFNFFLKKNYKKLYFFYKNKFNFFIYNKININFFIFKKYKNNLLTIKKYFWKKYNFILDTKHFKKLYNYKSFLKKTYKNHKPRISSKSIIMWYFENINNFLNIKKKNIWKIYFSKIFTTVWYNLRLWPKFLRKLKWFYRIKSNFIFYIYNTKKEKKLKNFKFFNFFKISNNVLKKKKKVNFLFNYNYFKFYFFFIKNKAIFKKKKKIFKNNLNNFFNKLFYPYNFNLNIKTKINKKKVFFLKYLYFNIFKHNFFRIFTFLKKQYFLSFLFTFWYKDISFLTFFIWSGFNKMNGGERYIIKIFQSFLRSINLLKYGILGIKFMLKGKLFKKRRKKRFFLKKGLSNLLVLDNNVKFINYNVFTRAGSYNFKCWLIFL